LKNKKGIIGPGVIVSVVLAMVVIVITIYIVTSRAKISLKAGSCENQDGFKCIGEKETCGDDYQRAIGFKCAEKENKGKTCCLESIV